MRSTRSTIVTSAAALLALALCVVETRAHAETVDTKPNAEELTNQAYELYKKGQYPLALSTYQRAYQISAATPILFNIANIYDRKLHERDLASEHYRRYLRSSDVDPELVRRANERLEAMKQEEEALKRNTPTPVTSESPTKASASPSQPVSEEPTKDSPQPSRSALPTVGYVTAGAGVVGLAVGSVFGILAMSKNNEASSMCKGNACSDDRAITLTDEARGAAGVSTAAFVVGGVLAAGGIAIVLFAPSGSASKEKSAHFVTAPRVGIGPRGIELSGAFF